MQERKNVVTEFIVFTLQSELRSDCSILSAFLTHRCTVLSLISPQTSRVFYMLFTTNMNEDMVFSLIMIDDSWQHFCAESLLLFLLRGTC